jgi:hypothetical protein
MTTDQPGRVAFLLFACVIVAWCAYRLATGHAQVFYAVCLGANLASLAVIVATMCQSRRP